MNWNTVRVLMLVQLGLTLAVLAVLLAGRSRRRGWREWYKDAAAKGKDGGVSFIDLAEFDALDPEIKELWGEFVEDGFLTLLMEDINANWKKASDSKKKQLRRELKAVLEKARADMKRGVAMVTKKPVAMATKKPAA